MGSVFMDFFSMDFSKLFLNKHGKEIFDDISNKIKEERGCECSDEYISSVFKIAFLSFFGFTEEQVQKLLDDIDKNNKINVKEVFTIQSNSISIITEYLESNIDRSVLEE